MGETLVAPPSAPGGGGTGDGTVADGAVTTAKVAVGAITETKLAAALVAKLNAPPALVDASVTTPKIVDGAVTEAKLEAALATKVNMPAGQISTLDARIAAIEALGSLATDAELIAAVANILGTADAAGDTLGELEALMTLRLLKTNNLSDLASVDAALTNLGFTAFSKTLLPLANVAALRSLIGTYSEVGYAERTANDTTTNGSLGSAPLVANRIVGLAVTVVGAGRPVELEFWCPGVYNSVANAYAGAVLLQDGVQISVGTVLSPNTGVGQVLDIKARKVLTAGQSYTFEVGKYGQGGTTTFAGVANGPMYLSATQR